jgi:hypothetical protein
VAKLGRHAMAVLVMAAIIAVLFVLCTPRATSRSSTVNPDPVARDTTANVRVMVVDFDPVIPDGGHRKGDAGEGTQRTLGPLRIW